MPEKISANKQSKPFETGPIEIEDALRAYKRVLETGGAILPRRDAVDSRTLSDVVKGTGKIIKSQNDVGGWTQLNSTPTLLKSIMMGCLMIGKEKTVLIQNREDRNRISSDGYTMLEKYINNIK